MTTWECFKAVAEGRYANRDFEEDLAMTLFGRGYLEKITAVVDTLIAERKHLKGCAHTYIGGPCQECFKAIEATDSALEDLDK